MLGNVTRHLDDRFTSRWVPYPASYGPAPSLSGMTYEDSVERGCENLADALAVVDGPVMLLGYSQGAVVVRRVVSGLAQRDPESTRRIVGIGLVADPHQPAGVVDGCSGSGVAGEGDPLVDAVPARWIGAPDDMICNASEDSLIRDVADLTGRLGFTDRRTVGSWVASMWNTLRSNDFQNAARTACRPAQWRHDVRRLRRAAREIGGYLPESISWRGWTLRNRRGGRHTSYAVEPYRADSLTECDATGCEILARWMQVRATFAEWTVDAEWDVARAA